MLYEIFAIVAPVLIIAFAGYTWERRGLPFDNNMVSTLVTGIGTPCLLLSTLLANRPDFVVMGQVALAAVAMLVMVGAAAFVVLKIMGQPVSVFLPAMTIPNTGNMGLPLMLFAFGAEGLALAVAFFATVTIVQFSLGVAIASGRYSLAGMLRTPVLWSTLAGVALMAADVTLPKWIDNTIAVLGDLVIPLMLLSLGTSLARLKVGAFWRSFGFAVFRLIAGFGVAVMLCAALGLDGAARGAVIVQSTMPTAVFNYLFALRYNNRPEEVAGVVLISTILSFLTLPLLLAFLLGA